MVKKIRETIKGTQESKKVKSSLASSDEEDVQFRSFQKPPSPANKFEKSDENGPGIITISHNFNNNNKSITSLNRSNDVNIRDYFDQSMFGGIHTGFRIISEEAKSPELSLHSKYKVGELDDINLSNPSNSISHSLQSDHYERPMPKGKPPRWRQSTKPPPLQKMSLLDIVMPCQGATKQTEPDDMPLSLKQYSFQDPVAASVLSCPLNDSCNSEIDFDDPPQKVMQIPHEKEQKKIMANKRLRQMHLNQTILYGVDLINKNVMKHKTQSPSQIKSLIRTTTNTFKKTQVDFTMLMDLLKNIDKDQDHEHEHSFLEELTICIDSQWKSYFDLIMLFASVYNSFIQAYYSAFGEPDELFVGNTLFIVNFLDYSIEVLFGLDFVFCFCQEYRDFETLIVVSDIKKIAKNYLRGSCVFDLLANIPFELIFWSGQAKTRLFRLFKLFRVPRLFALLNVNRVKQIIQNYYNKKLNSAVKNNLETESNSILHSMMLLYGYQIIRLVVIILACSYFLGIFWHILVCDFQTTTYVEPGNYYSGPVEQNFLTNKLQTDDPENTETPVQVMVKVFYFAITTLSTIGFGDFHPVSVLEKVIIAPILLFGVAVFSFIMGQFISILMNYKKLWIVGDGRGLQKWLGLLSKYNNGKPLNKELISKIENHFEYFWEHNRMSALSQEQDQKFMSDLPDYIQQDIYVDYIFSDFLYRYRMYFKPDETLQRIAKKNIYAQDPVQRDFMVQIVQKLEPRLYDQSKNDMIQDQYEEIFECVFITKGGVGVGYRFFNEIFYGTKIVQNKKKKNTYVINDYQSLHNKTCSEFLYQPIDVVEAFAIRKHHYVNVMKHPFAKMILPKINKRYKNLIQTPMWTHRKDLARKYQNRIDYVDIKSYDVGKVRIKKHIPKQIQYITETDELMAKRTDLEGRLLDRIAKFAEKTDKIKYSMSAMSQRHDKMMQMALHNIKPDGYQRLLIRKIFQQKKPQSNEFEINLFQSQK